MITLQEDHRVHLFRPDLDNAVKYIKSRSMTCILDRYRSLSIEGNFTSRRCSYALSLVLDNVVDVGIVNFNVVYLTKEKEVFCIHKGSVLVIQRGVDKIWFGSEYIFYISSGLLFLQAIASPCEEYPSRVIQEIIFSRGDDILAVFDLRFSVTAYLTIFTSTRIYGKALARNSHFEITNLTLTLKQVLLADHLSDKECFILSEEGEVYRVRVYWSLKNSSEDRYHLEKLKDIYGGTPEIAYLREGDYPLAFCRDGSVYSIDPSYNLILADTGPCNPLDIIPRVPVKSARQ